MACTSGICSRCGSSHHRQRTDARAREVRSSPAGEKRDRQAYFKKKNETGYPKAAQVQRRLINA